MIPGEYILAKENVECNTGISSDRITVMNTGDRPIQVGSHFHFFEVNRQMAFDREKAFGKRLNIASGTAVRFEPGEEKEIELIFLAEQDWYMGLIILSAEIPAKKKLNCRLWKIYSKLVSKIKNNEFAYQQDKICQYVRPDYR